MTGKSPVEPGPSPGEPEPGGLPRRRDRLRRILLGAPRDVNDPRTYRHVSLIALLAWVGLGADGLSSSAYGPEEAFRALGEHTLPRRRPRARHRAHRLHHLLRLQPDHRALPVRRRRLRRRDAAARPGAGVVSASALLVDYVLTITVSIAAAPTRSSASCPRALQRATSSRSSSRAIGAARAAQPARREGVGHGPRADLRALPGDPRDPHRRRPSAATSGEVAGDRPRGAHAGASRAASARSGSAGMAGALPARLLDGRRHLHRHRGGLQRPADHARAQGADRQAHHGLHGGLARPHRRRHPARLPALRACAGRRARR